METLIGITGAIIVLIAFILNEIGKLRAESFWYDLLNALGSALLVLYALIIASYPFAVLNAVWALVSLRDLVLRRG